MNLWFIWFLSGLSWSSPKLNVLINIGLSSRSHASGIFELANNMASKGHKIHYAAASMYLHYAKGFNFTIHQLDNIPEYSIHNILHMNNLIQEYRRHLNTLKLEPEYFIAAYHDYKTTFSAISSLVKENEFDLVICDFYSVGCRDAVEALKLPLVVGYQSTVAFDILNIPYISRNYDGGSTNFFSQAIFNRIYDIFFKDYEFSRINKVLKANIQRGRKEFGIQTTRDPLKPSTNSLTISTSFMGFEPAFHTPPNMLHLGPIPSSKNYPITQEIQEFLDSHRRVVFVGFGSLSILLPEDIRDISGALTNLINQGTIDGAIWGLGLTNLNITLHPDIKLVNWAPQQAILNHGNTKLFISHCGFESILESIHAVKPILCAPIIGDQTINSVKVREAGIGSFVPKYLSSPNLVSSLATSILKDYRGQFNSNLKRLKTISDYRRARAIPNGVSILEEYAYTAQACRPYQSPSEQLPCELLHLVPISDQQSFISSQLLDIYLILFFTILFSGTILFKLIVRIYYQFTLPKPYKFKSH